MELKQYFQIVRRWLWLLILGAVLGGGAGYYASRLQQPVYQATTQALVIRAPQEKTSDLTYLSDQQLVQTYVQLLTTQPVLDSASQRLGYKVGKSQIKVQQAQDTQILQVSVEDDESAAGGRNRQRTGDGPDRTERDPADRALYLHRGEHPGADRPGGEQISGLQSQVDQLSTQNFQDQLKAGGEPDQAFAG